MSALNKMRGFIMKKINILAAMILLTSTIEIKPLWKVNINGRPVHGLARFGVLGLSGVFTALTGAFVSAPVWLSGLATYGLYKGGNYINTNRKIDQIIIDAAQHTKNQPLLAENIRSIRSMPMKIKNEFLDCITQKKSADKESNFNECAQHAKNIQ